MVVYPLKGTAFQSREMLDAHPKPFFVCLFFVMCFYPVLHLERDWVSILHLFNGELRNYLEFPNHIMLVFVLCRVFLHSHPALQIRWRYAPKQRCDPHRSVDSWIKVPISSCSRCSSLSTSLIVPSRTVISS